MEAAAARAGKRQEGFTLKIAIACGGTGGHIFPGVATAGVLRSRGHDVKLWLAGKDIEAPALRDWPGEMLTVPAEGLPTGVSLRSVRALWRLSMAVFACRGLMKSDRPDVLLGMGSYACVGPVGAALTLRVPIVLHEANVLPGRAVSLFSRWATAVAGSFEETRHYLRRKHIEITGMPLRRDLERAAQRAMQNAERHDQWTVLVMGGSRGAHALNDVVSASLVRLHRHGHRLRAIHLTGAADEKSVREIYEKAGLPHDVRAFASDMAPLFAAADLAICRSGAATCAELAVFALPALLVPYPHAANNHQMFNARALEKLGAADVVPESDLGEDWLVDYVAGCMRAPERLARMSAASRGLAKRSASEMLADLVERTGRAGRAAGA